MGLLPGGPSVQDRCQARKSLPSSRLMLIRLFQLEPDILGVVEPSTTTAGSDLKGPDMHEPTCLYRSAGHNPDSFRMADQSGLSLSLARQNA